jgi:hypothetical protein
VAAETAGAAHHSFWRVWISCSAKQQQALHACSGLQWCCANGAVPAATAAQRATGNSTAAVALYICQLAGAASRVPAAAECAAVAATTGAKVAGC